MRPLIGRKVKFIVKLSKAYEPNQYEADIYAMWEKSGAFDPKGSGEPYCIVMPPPNANGNLHVGHALTLSLQDILVRYYRMRGRDVVYIPGADHAGFETWVVYDRILEQEGKNRFDFSREQLYSQVWNFVDKQRGNMELQMRALGASASWKNLVFTLDEKVIKTIYRTFKKMWDEGLIYRGERIVNYSTKYRTSYADIEVDHRKEKGTLWNIAYPMYDRVGEVVIATTRPETLFGDTAVAVNPNDHRFKDLLGRRVTVPFVNRQIPIIADESVDPTYGTGIVKITPAHDPNDFETGKRHNLKRIQVIDFDGKMINVPEEFAGLTAAEARTRVLAALKAQDLLRGEKTIEHTVGYDYKSGLPIEPLIKEQWFIKVKPLVDRAKQVVQQDKIKFLPAGSKHILMQYFDNLHDWNISRQIPWGIPIPAFENVEDSDDWIYNENVDEKTIEVDGKIYRREEDTFDTWFSSGQWPFIVTDYLENGELSRFYPTSLMETGGDLLYAWVARMIMLGLYATDKIPFENVYLHGLVLDNNGRKMSKSKGNVVNPMETIAEYGSDALRLGIIASRSPGQNQAFGVGKVVAGRNFCNKLWNIARFAENKLAAAPDLNTPTPKTMVDHWIIGQLDDAIETVDKQLAGYHFAEASEAVYHVIWNDVADWYIEASKNQINQSMLAWVMDTSLRLAHPFAPFVTETIWQTLPWCDDLLITATWPKPVEYNTIEAAEFTRLQELISEVRYVTSELPGNDKYTLLFQNDSLITDNVDLVKRLAGLKSVESVDSPRGLRLALSGREAWLDISAKLLSEHQNNLKTRLTEVDSKIQVLKKRLENENYLQKAPQRLVEDTQNSLKEQQALEKRLHHELEVIS